MNVKMSTLNFSNLPAKKKYKGLGGGNVQKAKTLIAMAREFLFRIHTQTILISKKKKI